MLNQDRLERRAFLTLLLLVSVLFLFVLKPFFGAIFWAVAIAVIFAPIQHWLARRWGDKPNRIAATTLCICIVLLVMPTVFVATSLVTEAVNFMERVEAGEFNPGKYLDQIRDAFPLVQSLLDRFSIDFNSIRNRVVEAAMGGGKLAASQALALGQDTFSLLLNITLALYVAFFLLRDGNTLVQLLIRALPIGDARERLLFAKFAEVTRATIKGSLVIAIIQGMLGGIIFWILGITGALLWGVVMAVVSLIPAVGAALIWAPVSVYLLATGEWIPGLVLLGFGVGVIGLVDNLLRPVLVGRDTKLPDYVVLLSTLGGLSLFGMNGLIIGPLVAALFIAFWEIFIREFNSPMAAKQNELKP